MVEDCKQAMDMNDLIKNINTIPDLSKGLICRTCLVPLQDETNQIIYNDDIYKKLMNCTTITVDELNNSFLALDSHIICNFQVAEGDGLPIYICYNCMQQLSIVCKFKVQVESSDNTLRQFVEYRNSLKNEVSRDEIIDVLKTEEENKVELECINEDTDNVNVKYYINVNKKLNYLF